MTSIINLDEHRRPDMPAADFAALMTFIDGKRRSGLWGHVEIAKDECAHMVEVWHVGQHPDMGHSPAATFLRSDRGRWEAWTGFGAGRPIAEGNVLSDALRPWA